MEFKVGDKYKFLFVDTDCWLEGHTYEITSILRDGIVQMSTETKNFNGTAYSIDCPGIWQKVESLENITKETEMNFQVGDIVSFGGDIGNIISTTNISVIGKPIKVVFKDAIEYFTLDGKYAIYHIEPLLKLIERPKKKVKKTFYTMIFKSSGQIPPYSAGFLFETEVECREYNNRSVYPIVPIEIEVEE